MFIAIEGVDGSGKSTIAKELANRLGFKYVEKPFSFAFSDNALDKYSEIKTTLGRIHDKELSCWFYGLNSLFTSKYFADENIVCDRGLVSNFSWLVDDETIGIYDALLKFTKVPDITFVFVMEKELLKERIKQRDSFDWDNSKLQYIDKCVANTLFLLNKAKAKYYVIDRTFEDVEQTVGHIVSILNTEGILNGVI